MKLDDTRPTVKVHGVPALVTSEGWDGTAEPASSTTYFGWLTPAALKTNKFREEHINLGSPHAHRVVLMTQEVRWRWWRLRKR